MVFTGCEWIGPVANQLDIPPAFHPAALHRDLLPAKFGDCVDSDYIEFWICRRLGAGSHLELVTPDLVNDRESNSLAKCQTAGPDAYWSPND